MASEIRIQSDIRKASTLPAEVYTDSRYYDLQRERVFARSWQLIPELHQVVAAGQVAPWMLLEGCLDEPLLLTRDRDGGLHCLSNVCTHRANLVVDAPCRLKTLRCRYHGRRFDLHGRFLSMPEFEDAVGFPSDEDHLPALEVQPWGPLGFTSLRPGFAFDEWIEPVRRRVGWMPLGEFSFDQESSRDYSIDANWALYCDNYLEGFHIPFVHEGLATTLEYDSYTTETFALCNLQVGIAKEGQPAFELPTGHPDEGRRIAAYYFWMFPNTMLNFYPWGLSVNLLEPLAVDRSQVRFLSYVWDAGKREHGAGAGLHSVELEDEEVVRSCQRGVRSRLYRAGRYSPTREVGVHQFHRLLGRFLAQAPVDGP